MFEILAIVWDESTSGWHDVPPAPVAATGTKQKAWKSEIGEIVIGALRSDDKYMWCDAISLAGSLRLEEALPEITKIAKQTELPKHKSDNKNTGDFMVIYNTASPPHNDYHIFIPKALKQINSDEK
jgi:hypothetical protein